MERSTTTYYVPVLFMVQGKGLKRNLSIGAFECAPTKLRELQKTRTMPGKLGQLEYTLVNCSRLVSCLSQCINFINHSHLTWLFFERHAGFLKVG